MVDSCNKIVDVGDDSSLTKCVGEKFGMLLTGLLRRNGHQQIVSCRLVGF